MARIVSVDKSIYADGTARYFVTTEDTQGSKQKIEVREEEAKRFQEAMKSGGGPRVLTETMPNY